MKIIRQGDVLLSLISKLPEGCKEVPPVNGSIILAFGEVTGHAHRIDSGTSTMTEAGRLARNVLHTAKARARLLESPNGTRFLQVLKPVTLRHEEHKALEIPKGIYELPHQVEHTADKIVRRVAD